jgi:predicted HTH transcriptional regulator
MDLKALKSLVSQGEGLQLEFKLKAAHPEKIVREVVAFANSAGGILLIGVGDDKSIRGVKFADEEDYLLSQAIQKHCQPGIPYILERIPLADEREVLAYHIPKSPLRPHQVFTQSDQIPKVYVRVEDRSVQASREMREVLKGEKKQRSYRFQYGDKERLLMQYLGSHPHITVEEFARLANIPRQIASRTLVLLVLSNVLRIHPEEVQDFFLRNEEAA